MTSKEHNQTVDAGKKAPAFIRPWVLAFITVFVLMGALDDKICISIDDLHVHRLWQIWSVIHETLAPPGSSARLPALRLGANVS